MSGFQFQCLELTGKLAMRNGSELAGQLKTALASGEPILIDAGKVEAIDVSAIQLLVAALKTGRRRKISMALSAPRDGALAKCLGEIGFVTRHGIAIDPFWLGTGAPT